MRTRRALFVMSGLVLLTSLAAGDDFVGKEALLGFSREQMPTDTAIRMGR